MKDKKLSQLVKTFHPRKILLKIGVHTITIDMMADGSFQIYKAFKSYTFQEVTVINDIMVCRF